MNFLFLSKEEIVAKYIDLEKRFLILERENAVLRKEIRQYKNSNTPPSSNKHLKPNTFGKQAKKPAKRGAPKGHKGTTRIRKAEIFEDVDSCECPRCKSTNVRDKKIFKRIIEDSDEPPKPVVKNVNVHYKHCNDCDLDFIPPQNTIPLRGTFGINLMILVVFIKFLLRGVLRKTSCFIENGFALKMTPASVNEIIKRVAEAAEKEYEQMKERIRNSAKVYVDETSFSILGINQWVWIFRTSSDVLLVIRPSRGSKVLEEILGREYRGTVICDCWRAYDFLSFATIQRCWAHLLRKTKELCNTIAGKHLHEKISKFFEEIKEFNSSSKTQEERLAKYNEMTNKLDKITRDYLRYEELESVIKYIRFHLEDWFTCIKIEGIEPTNNFAEQSLRESVIVRKIIGAFRSEQGKENYETLASVIASWQLRGLDLKQELKQMLIKNLCFI